MSLKVGGQGTVALIRCDCGWFGMRARSSTQPCPACEEPLDWRSALAKARAANRAHEEKLRNQEKAWAERSRRDREARLAREAEEAASISAMLRASVEDLRPLRRTTT